MRSRVPLDEYTLDPRAVRRAFDRASRTYADAAGVQTEIRTRLLERLDLVKLEPARVLDLGAASGGSTRALKNRYPKAQVIALDLSPRMLAAAAREQSFFRRFDRIACDAHRLALKEASIDLVFSNLMLAWCDDLDAVLEETARVLRPDGLFMFTTLGPDTLRELRDAFRHVDDRTHVHRFLDMHDIGDALMRAGFADPVLDTERLTATYPDARTLLTELRRTGSINATHGRPRGLFGPRKLDEVARLLDENRRDGRLPISLEVVYGHAWKGQPRAGRGTPGEVAIPLSELRGRIRKI
jgi:biotin biosynthesis protein BioC